MEKELKIAELATIWGVSVPTCWNRIKKEGLKTFKKKDETNKDITYISISDDIINKYVINDVNNVNNNINNGYYEELLTDNKINNAENAAINSDIIKGIINLNKVYNEELKTVHNDYNDKIEKLREELTTTKQQQLLLEDKAGREGFYIKENNELKEEIKKINQATDAAICKKDRLIKILISFIVINIMAVLMLITYLLTVYNMQNQDIEKPLQTESITAE